MSVIEVKLTEIPQYKIKQLLELAGFKSEQHDRYVKLIDKNTTQSDDYSDLTFKNIIDAAISVKDYLAKINYQVVM